MTTSYPYHTGYQLHSGYELRNSHTINYKMYVLHEVQYMLRVAGVRGVSCVKPQV